MDQQLDTTEVWLTFSGPIDDGAVSRFFSNFQLLFQGKTEKAHLLIQSTGGGIGQGLAIYNFIKNLPFEIITYNAGSVESIAVLVYLAGKVRRTASCSAFLIHKTTFGFLKPPTASEMTMRAEIAKLADDYVEGILHSETSLPEEKWLIHKTTDLVIGAAEAVSYRLAHEIADFKPERGKIMATI